MARKKKETAPREPSRKLQPVFSPEAAENQAIGLAFNLVLERLQDGTASAQETVHFLKLGSSKMQLEKERLKSENELLRTKVDTLQAAQRTEELYQKALSAMKRYSGNFEEEEEDYSRYVEYEDFDD